MSEQMRNTRAPERTNANPQARRPSAGPNPGARPKSRPSDAARPTGGGQAGQRPSQNARPLNRTTAQARGANASGANTPAPRRVQKKDTKKIIFEHLKTAGRVSLAILKFIGILLAAGAGAVWSVLTFLNKKLDVFRKTESAKIITNSAVGAFVVCIILIIAILLAPSVNAKRARNMAQKGNAEEAIRIVEKLERDGYREKKLLKTKYSVLESLLENEKYAQAREVLSSMEKTDKTSAFEKKLNYREAGSLYKSGQYSASAQMFYQMPDYQDSTERYYDCRCALAIESYLNGHENLVQGLLLDIPDVASRVQKVANEISKSDQERMNILTSEAFSEETLEHFEQTVLALAEAKKSMPSGKIAAGYRHTLGLMKDGRVVAAGDNSYGQSNVSMWSNVVQVAAGAYHSVALFKDGTVDAVGDNSQNQLDVYSWTDIVYVCASAYGTFGLKSDGTVVACGMNADLVSGWHGVTMITGGAHAVGCLYDKGYMLSTHQGAQMDMSAVMYDLSVYGGVAAGVLYDGSLIASVENAPEWTDIVSVQAGSTAIFAIDKNGSVLSYYYRASDDAGVNVPSKAVEIATGGTHHVVLTEDGRVYSFGNNDFGQLNTQGWSL